MDWDDPAQVRAAIDGAADHPQLCLSCGAGCDLLGMGDHRPGCTHPAAGARTILELAQRTLPELPEQVGVEAAARQVFDEYRSTVGRPEAALALWVLALLPVYHAARDLHELGVTDGVTVAPWAPAWQRLRDSLR